jgi:hypothetical protein
MLKRRLCLITLLFLLPSEAHAVQDEKRQARSLDSLLIANRKPLTLDGTQAWGPGFDLLIDSAAEAQFFLIGEEHNLLELNRLAVALFDTLQARFGYQYLVLEQGNIIASWMDEAARVGGMDSVASLVRAYPQAPTYATDEELELIVHARQTSAALGPAVWGVDQELAAMHLLQRLTDSRRSPEARAELERLAEQARPYESTRTGDVHYLYSVADQDEFTALEGLVEPLEHTEQRALMDALQRTARIYANRRTPLGAYESGREREASMKERFMEHYRIALQHEDLPKAIVKMGHWHTFRGVYRGDVPTFGNFLSEFATSSGSESVMAATYVVNGPDEWRNSGGVFDRVADPNGIVVIDLRPLRPLAHQDMIADLSQGLRNLIFQADLLLIIGGGRTGSYSVAYGED